MGQQEIGRILNCYNLGKVSANTCGGIIGSFYCNSNEAKTNLEVLNCYNVANVVGTSTASGIVGLNYTYSKPEISTIRIENCYNNGNIEATNGIASGILRNNPNSNSNTSISNVYNTGNIIGKTSGVGIIYSKNIENKTDISNAYYLDNIEKGTENILQDNTIKMTSNDMKQSSFVDTLNKNVENSKNKNILLKWKLGTEYPSFE